jgi:acylphosphatase
VTGRVQGVGFRWWTRSRGARLALAGTVRNVDDGSVVVHVRGEGAAVDRLRRSLGEGPPSARVDAVEEIPFSPDGLRDGEFIEIR